MSDGLKMAAFILLLIVAATKSAAQTVPDTYANWRLDFIRGNIESCSSQNIQTLFHGYEASALFNDMMASLQLESTTALKRRVVCYIDLIVRIARGKSLLSFNSALTGSVLKDVNTTGTLKLMHSFKDTTTNGLLLMPNGQNQIGSQVNFSANQEIVPLTATSFKHTFGTRDMYTMCSKGKVNGFDLKISYAIQLQSIRQNLSQSIDVSAYGLDSGVVVRDCSRMLSRRM